MKRPVLTGSQIDIECPIKKGLLKIKKEVDIPKQVVCAVLPFKMYLY